MRAWRRRYGATSSARRCASERAAHSALRSSRARADAPDSSSQLAPGGVRCDQHCAASPAGKADNDDGLEPLTEWRDALRAAGYTAESLDAAFASADALAELKSALELGDRDRVAWLALVGALRKRLGLRASEPQPTLAPVRVHLRALCVAWRSFAEQNSTVYGLHPARACRPPVRLHPRARRQGTWWTRPPSGSYRLSFDYRTCW